MRKSSDSNPASSRFAVRQVIGIARDAPSAEVAGVVLRKDLHPQPKVRVAVDALTRLTAETPPIFNTGDIVE